MTAHMFESPHIKGVRVIGLDTGADMGFAYNDVAGKPYYGIERLGDDPDLRWRGLWGFLNRRHELHGPFDFLWMELSTWSRETHAMLDHGGFISIIRLFCTLNGVAYRTADPKTIKKHLTGDGYASKAAMIRAARALGYKVSNDNVADGIAIFDYGRAMVARERMLQRRAS